MSTVSFSMRMDPELKEGLEQEAKLEDRSVASVAQRAIGGYLRAKQEKRRIIEEAFAEADKGIFISEEAMTRWVESWDTNSELPPPEPDIFPDSQPK